MFNQNFLLSTYVTVSLGGAIRSLSNITATPATIIFLVGLVGSMFIWWLMEQVGLFRRIGLFKQRGLAVKGKV